MLFCSFIFLKLPVDKDLKIRRLRVVSHSISPSSEARKKPARKNMAAREPGGEKHTERETTV